jgi:hypothetical protein
LKALNITIKKNEHNYGSNKKAIDIDHEFNIQLEGDNTLSIPLLRV